MKLKHRRRGRIALAAITALGLVAGVSACSAAGGSDGALKMWVVGPSTKKFKTQFTDALAAYTKESGTKVNLTIYQNDQFKQQIANATGTPTMPDVFVNWSGIGLLGNIYDAGAIEPLDKYYDKYKWEDRYTAASLPFDKIDGKYIGVPFMVQEMAVVYKKSTLEKAGITPPKTYDELLSDMDKLKGQGVTPWSFGGKNSWDTMRLTDSLLETKCGADSFDKLRDLKTDWTTSSCAKAGFSELQSWVDKGYLTKDFMALDPNAGDQYKPIFDGSAAFTIDGNWSGPSLQNLGANLDDYAYFAFPTDTDRLSFFTNSLYMSAGSKNKDAAAGLIDFLTQKSTLEKYPTILQGTLPATKDVAQQPGLSAYDAGWAPLGEQFKGGYEPSDQAFPPDVATDFLLNQDKLVLGQQSPAQTVAAIQASAEKYKQSKK